MSDTQEKASPWFVERYTLARRIYHIRDQQAHAGFTDKRTGREVPAQTWAEWFAWCYGMPLDEYAHIAKEGKHAAQIPAAEVALLEYRLSGDAAPDKWYLVRGAVGETYEELDAWMRRCFPDIVETRRRP
jgi:hypothetical protein